MFHQLQTNNQFEPATLRNLQNVYKPFQESFSRNEQEDADEYLITILSAFERHFTQNSTGLFFY